MSQIKLCIVAGGGGARADFVAGWLGTLPGFVNNFWFIDPFTGVSYGRQGDIRSIDSGQSIESILQNTNLELNKNAKFTWSTACHGYWLKGADYQAMIDAGSIKFLSIDTRGADQNKISWEFITKTYLSHRKQMDSVRGFSEQWLIDTFVNKPHPTDQDRIDRLKSMILERQKNGNLSFTSLNSSVPGQRIKYTELFQAGGSRYLCDQLEIDVSNCYHRYWDSMLEFSNSPETIDVWGVEWRRQDCFSN
jgi:hypothetical protein